MSSPPQSRGPLWWAFAVSKSSPSVLTGLGTQQSGKWPSQVEKWIEISRDLSTSATSCLLSTRTNSYTTPVSLTCLHNNMHVPGGGNNRAGGHGHRQHKKSHLDISSPLPYHNTPREGWRREWQLLNPSRPSGTSLDILLTLLPPHLDWAIP